MYSQYTDQQINDFERTQRERMAAEARAAAELSQPEPSIHLAIAALATWLGALATTAVRTLGRIAHVRAML
jgi:hypothetical protein